ncbi:hypothetical protein BB559_002665 [Furculomyces boomerangus]|uniref:Altered inheritance of mitochondria protein 41 n=1 Tax=Furculomyces boomerangus TaxID=61424 RepID=A0A2T9YTK1_9FUNG|nr:hypothetical protein BB559_002665 [Furculomyces boomerangus]
MNVIQRSKWLGLMKSRNLNFRFYTGSEKSVSIYGRLRDDMKVSMKEKNMKKLNIIKTLISSINYAEKDQKDKTVDIKQDDAKVIGILQKAIEQREDSISEFDKAGRKELSEIEREQIDAIKQYLPRQLSEEEIREKVNAAIKEVGATGLKSMGEVMKRVKIDQSEASRAKVTSIAKSLLSSN